MLAISTIGEFMASPSSIEVVPATAIHVGLMRNNLRPEDAQEILRFGISVSHGLWLSYRHALVRKTAFVDGKIAAMWGCNGDILGQSGQPWLLTTPEVHNISPLRFARMYQEEVKSMLDTFPVLVNYVDSGYDNAIRLLDIIGFEIGEPEPMGENKAMYRRFEMRKQ